MQISLATVGDVQQPSNKKHSTLGIVLGVAALACISTVGFVFFGHLHPRVLVNTWVLSGVSPREEFLQTVLVLGRAGSYTLHETTTEQSTGRQVQLKSTGRWSVREGELILDSGSIGEENGSTLRSYSITQCEPGQLVLMEGGTTYTFSVQKLNNDPATSND